MIIKPEINMTRVEWSNRILSVNKWWINLSLESFENWNVIEMNIQSGE